MNNPNYLKKTLVKEHNLNIQYNKISHNSKDLSKVKSIIPVNNIKTLSNINQMQIIRSCSAPLTLNKSKILPSDKVSLSSDILEKKNENIILNKNFHCNILSKQYLAQFDEKDKTNTNKYINISSANKVNIKEPFYNKMISRHNIINPNTNTNTNISSQNPKKENISLNYNTKKLFHNSLKSESIKEHIIPQNILPNIKVNFHYKNNLENHGTIKNNLTALPFSGKDLLKLYNIL